MKVDLLKTQIGDNVRRLRKQKGLSTVDFARLLQKTRASVVNIEKGKQALTIQTIFLACSILGCQPNDLFPPILTATVEYETIEVPTTKKVKNVKLVTNNH